MRDSLAAIYMDRKVGAAVPPFFLGGGHLGPHLTQCRLAEAYTSVPSGILIRPAVWPQQTRAKNWGDSWVPI